MNDFQQALQRWALAQKIAKETGHLQIEANGKGAAECTRVSDLCAQRMSELHDAEETLMKFKDSCDVSDSIRAFVAAEAD